MMRLRWHDHFILKRGWQVGSTIPNDASIYIYIDNTFIAGSFGSFQEAESWCISRTDLMIKEINEKFEEIFLGE